MHYAQPLQDLSLEGAEGDPLSPELAVLVFETQEEFPGFKLVEKEDSLLMSVLAVLAKPFNPDFMEDHCTLLGRRLYHPSGWSDLKVYEAVCRKRVWLRDVRRWWPIMWLTLLLPLPVVLSGRAYWYFRGYEESLRVIWERRGMPRNRDGSPRIDISSIRWAVSHFTGPSHLWMFPFPTILERAFRRAASRWK